MPYAEAVAQRFHDRLGNRATFDTPAFTGRARARRLSARRAGAEYIDWSPFFLTWELKGKYPQDLRRSERRRGGPQAVRRRPAAARRDRREQAAHGPRRVWLLAGRQSTATTSSSTPTNRAATKLTRFHTLRQQWERKGQNGVLRRWPTTSPRVDSGRQDYLGAFAVTAGIGCDELVGEFERDHDDYNSIMAKALADRLAEAFAEMLHAAGPPRLGLRPRRAADQRRADRREVPRHPPRARLSRPARPHREADAVRPARRRDERPASR